MTVIAPDPVGVPETGVHWGLLLPPQEAKVHPMTTTMEPSRTRRALGLEQAISIRRKERKKRRENRVIQGNCSLFEKLAGHEGRIAHTTGAVVLIATLMVVPLELEIFAEAGHDVKVASGGAPVQEI